MRGSIQERIENPHASSLHISFIAGHQNQVMLKGGGGSSGDSLLNCFKVHSPDADRIIGMIGQPVSSCRRPARRKKQLAHDPWRFLLPLSPLSPTPLPRGANTAGEHGVRSPIAQILMTQSTCQAIQSRPETHRPGSSIGRVFQWPLR